MNIRATSFLTRRPLAWVCLAALALLASGSAWASQRWETLEAIHWVENPTDSPRPGPFGELGAYQFRESTWRMHTRLPFTQALNRNRADAVAVEHYEWIKRGLERRGVHVTPYTVALAWNGGITAACGNATRATRDYAERVANIAQHLRQSQVAMR